MFLNGGTGIGMIEVNMLFYGQIDDRFFGTLMSISWFCVVFSA